MTHLCVFGGILYTLPLTVTVLIMSLSLTSNTNEDREAKADQENDKDQDEVSFGESVEPHGGQSVKGRKDIEDNENHSHNQRVTEMTRVKFVLWSVLLAYCGSGADMSTLLASMLVYASSNIW